MFPDEYVEVVSSIATEQENDATELHEAQVVHRMTLVAHHQSSEVAQLGAQALDLPTPSIASQLTPILSAWLASVAPMGGNHLDPASGQACIQWVAVIRPISNQSFRWLGGEAACQGGFNECDFMGASTCDADGDRKTSAVCHCHELRTFAPLGLSHPVPPFLPPRRRHR